MAASAVVVGIVLAGAPVRAQNPAPSADTSTAASLSEAQLQQLVAPIALYPDNLLSQILMASTYPLEVVQAARWSKENPNVTGKALENAMAKQSWDPSVKALTAVPQALQMMSDKLDWTQQLGNAFLAQQEDVLDAVQKLRQRADASGNLKSTPQQRVTTTPRSSASGAPAPVITIASTNPEELYVPIYDPGVVFGTWPYPDYAPYYWYPPGYVGAGVFSFAAGVAVGAAIWGGVDWYRRNVNVNVNRFNSFNRTNITSNAWNHNARHRGNVPYANPNVAQRFGDHGKGAAREQFRGRADQGRRDLANQGRRDAGNRGTNQNLRNAAARRDGSRQAGTQRTGQRNAGQRNAGQRAGKSQARNRQAGRSSQVARNRGSGQRVAHRSAGAGPRGGLNRSAGGRAAGGGRSFARSSGGGRGGGMRGGGGRGRR